jgi:excisionase family DNA binding protein
VQPGDQKRGVNVSHQPLNRDGSHKSVQLRGLSPERCCRQRRLMVMNAAHATAAPKKRQSRLGTPPANALTYRVDDAAAMLGIGRVSLYRLIGAGKLRPVKIAGRTLISRSEIERIAASGTGA